MQWWKSLHHGMAALVLAGVSASSAWAMSAVEKQVAQKASKLFAGQELAARQLPQGLFEILVVNEKAIFYVDKDVRFLFDGQLYDVQQQVNLTQQREEDLMRIQLSDLNMKDAIQSVNGKGSRQLIVFEDPNCGFCRQLRGTLATIPDLTVHFFLIPVLGEDSLQKSQRIVCAADPASTLHTWMEKGVAPPVVNVSGACTEGLARNRSFAQRHRITGTPTLFFSDGSRMTGAQPAAAIQQKLASLGK